MLKKLSAYIGKYKLRRCSPPSRAVRGGAGGVHSLLMGKIVDIGIPNKDLVTFSRWAG
jgi:hypothetical protein